jgi:hypothetical protein
MKFLRGFALLLCVLALLPAPARAHVGSKDVFEETAAGPYKLFVTIRPPVVIPGVAGVEVRASGAPVSSISIAPLTLTGVGSEHPPSPDLMKRSGVDPNFYTGSVWMMQTGSMQVRFDVDGASGKHTAAVPVPAIALNTLKMQSAFGWTLATCGIILILGMGGIVGAAVREGKLQPGAAPTPSLRRRGLVLSTITVVLCLGIVWAGDKWWNVEAANFANTIYQPLTVATSVQGDHLTMVVQAHHSTRADQTRSNDDFILDHGQPMHLYVVREPDLDEVYHLHPKFTHAGEFDLNLPTMPAGKYTLYGDVVHANGFPETLVSTINLPNGIHGVPLTSPDAEGHPSPLSAGELGTSYKLPDGYTMVWEKPSSLTVNTAYAFHFELLGPDGKPATHMRTYLGMAGHAAFLKTDGTVFAHVHPAGSAAMAAVMLADNQGSTAASDAGGSGMAGMPGMAGMEDTDAAIDSNAVEFPYGFPSAGRYRIFVQMKHDSTVETGVFDAVVK